MTVNLRLVPTSQTKHQRDLNRPFFVFDTHPIQYRSPVFQLLYERFSSTKVFFFNSSFQANKWWFHEKGQIPKQIWEVPLLQGFPNRILNTEKLGLLGVYRNLKALFVQENPQAVMIYGYYQWEHWLILRLCKKFGVPLLFVGETFQDRAQFPRNMLRHLLRGYFFSNVNKFIAIGKRSAWYYENAGIVPTRIVQAKYCVDTSFFELSDQEACARRKYFRNNHSIPDDAFVILFVGRLVERKRPVDVINLYHKLVDDPELYVCIVGNGVLEETLKKSALATDSILFLGFQNQSQTRDSYYGADILYLPSTYETWGLVVNEAFSASLPAIVTEDCGVAGDLVVPNETGFVVPVGDISLASRYIRQMRSNPTLLEKMRYQAKQKVIKKYSTSQFADAILKAVDEVQFRN